jgi:hypothetical protein
MPEYFVSLSLQHLDKRFRTTAKPQATRAEYNQAFDIPLPAAAGALERQVVVLMAMEHRSWLASGSGRFLSC